MSSNKISKYINLIAVEIEGVWYNLDGCRGPKVLNEIGQPVHDGSVKFPKVHKNKFLKIYEENRKKNAHVGYPPITSLMHKGEVVSSPFGSMLELSKWMSNYWPDLTNNTCGLHFHVSLNTHGYYSCLMDEKFYPFFKNKLADFAAQEKLNKVFQDRFYNKTEWAKKYCNDTFHPEKQAYVNHKIYHDKCPDRYTILNYCFGLHSTLEIRVFSAHMSPKMAIKSAHWWVNCVNEYLENNYEEFSKYAISTDEISIEIKEEKSIKKLSSEEEVEPEYQNFLTFDEPSDKNEILEELEFNNEDFLQELNKYTTQILSK